MQAWGTASEYLVPVLLYTCLQVHMSFFKMLQYCKAILDVVHWFHCCRLRCIIYDSATWSSQTALLWTGQQMTGWSLLLCRSKIGSYWEVQQSQSLLHGLCWHCKLTLHTDIVYWHCILTLYTDIVHWHCILTLYTDISQAECRYEVPTSSLRVLTVWSLSSSSFSLSISFSCFSANSSLRPDYHSAILAICRLLT